MNIVGVTGVGGLWALKGANFGKLLLGQLIGIDENNIFQLKFLY